MMAVTRRRIDLVHSSGDLAISALTRVVVDQRGPITVAPGRVPVSAGNSQAVRSPREATAGSQR
jgi:hypothetical protein